MATAHNISCQSALQSRRQSSEWLKVAKGGYFHLVRRRYSAWGLPGIFFRCLPYLIESAEKYADFLKKCCSLFKISCRQVGGKSRRLQTGTYELIQFCFPRIFQIFHGFYREDWRIITGGFWCKIFYSSNSTGGFFIMHYQITSVVLTEHFYVPTVPLCRIC